MPPRRPTSVRRKAPSRGAAPKWASWSDARLLDLPLKELGLSIEGTWLMGPIERLQQELLRKGLAVKLHFWLSEEWFCPDGVPGVAVPFFLAHPRLIRLERAQMHEAEGSNFAWCMKLLRHEAGHAIQNAYRLHRRSAWREVFGRSTKTYPSFYRAEPTSRDYVVHLYNFYAQSHPAEDFAETFAVWLPAASRWREKYRGWPALKKLRYVDTLMGELADVTPPVRSRRVVDPLHSLGKTLRDYYAEKRAHYGLGFTNRYDRELRKVFALSERGRAGRSAFAFVREHEKALRASVAQWTGEYDYVVEEVLREVLLRTKQLSLRVTRPARDVQHELALLLTAHTMRRLYMGRERHPL